MRTGTPTSSNKQDAVLLVVEGAKDHKGSWRILFYLGGVVAAAVVLVDDVRTTVQPVMMRFAGCGIMVESRYDVDMNVCS